MHLELINNTLTTMLLDCISHYPERGQEKECFGLIFGEQNEHAIGEYTFPIGNVVSKTAVSITPDNHVNEIVKEARKLVATSDFVAYYHSHPYDEKFDNWADPSVGDVRAAKEVDSNIEVIFAIVKSKEEDETANLTIEYRTDTQFLFFDKKEAMLGDEPASELIGEEGNIICGHYKDYDFQVRAYYWNGKALEEIHLYSSEVEMNMALLKEGIIIEKLSKEAMYYFKKLEYSLRLNNKEKYKDKIPFLIEKIKSVGVNT